MDETITYSVVVPVFNSERTLNELVRRLTRVFESISSPYEILLIDDCSSDESWRLLQEFHKKDRKIKIIRLRKNSGQHNALLCGLNHAKGGYIITLDDDLQHPPEEIPKLIDKTGGGYAVVYGRYKTKQHGRIENFFSNCFQTLIHYTLDLPPHIFISSFAIFTSDVAKNMTSIRTSSVFLPALLVRSVPAKKITNVEVIHAPRRTGVSNYTIRKYLSLTFSLIISNVDLPLFIVGFFGMLVILLSMWYGIYTVFQYLAAPTRSLMDWTSLVAGLAFLLGMILFSLYITGEYLLRILTEVSRGPQYVIGEMEL